MRTSLWSPDSCCKRDDGAVTIRLDDPAKWEPRADGLVVPMEVAYPIRFVSGAGYARQNFLTYITTWRGNTVSSTSWDSTPQETPEGEVEQEPIDLGTCWRCVSAKVDRSDVVGLCGDCKRFLAAP